MFICPQNTQLSLGGRSSARKFARNPGRAFYRFQYYDKNDQRNHENRSIFFQFWNSHKNVENGQKFRLKLFKLIKIKSL